MTTYTITAAVIPSSGGLIGYSSGSPFAAGGFISPTDGVFNFFAYSATGTTVSIIANTTGTVTWNSQNYPLTTNLGGGLWGFTGAGLGGPYPAAGNSFNFDFPGGPAGYTLTADAGAFALTGQNATLAYGRVLAADAGSFALSGQAANFVRGFGLIADAGTFALTGQNAGFIYNRILAAGAGAFVLTGQDAILQRTGIYVLSADAGAFALTGQTAGLLVGHKLPADVGAFTLSGQAANLLRSRLLTAAAGSFILTGQAALFVRGYGLAATGGQFVLTGLPVNLFVNRIIRLPQKFVRLLPDNRWVGRDVNLMGADRLTLFAQYQTVDLLGIDATQWLDGAFLTSVVLDFGYYYPITAQNNSTIALIKVPHDGERHYGTADLIASDGRKRTIDIELVPL